MTAADCGRAGLDAPTLVWLCHRYSGTRRLVVTQLNREGIQVGKAVVLRLLKAMVHFRAVGASACPHDGRQPCLYPLQQFDSWLGAQPAKPAMGGRTAMII
jgi:hypothetical protein